MSVVKVAPAPKADEPVVLDALDEALEGENDKPIKIRKLATHTVVEELRSRLQDSIEDEVGVSRLLDLCDAIADRTSRYIVFGGGRHRRIVIEAQGVDTLLALLKDETWREAFPRDQLFQCVRPLVRR